ncbi:MAG: 50S ribosomal protein L6 [bacterium]|nr:50S ribosomal protein L6 [bacterium]
MSKIGKQPVVIPSAVQISLDRGGVSVVGPKGELWQKVPSEVKVEVETGAAKVSVGSEEKRVKALHGLIRSLIANMVQGVSEGFSKTLELSGVGFRATLQGEKLVLSVGYSHQVEIDPPEGIVFLVKENKITVSGIDKQLVGEVAAKIRKVRPAEPYKGKGIKYEGEQIRRKAGKAGKVGTGA